MYPGRVTPLQLGSIVELDLVTFPDVTVFINEANTLTTRYCVTDVAVANLPPYDDDTLYLIELNLSAWSYCMSDPRTTTERAGPVGQSVQHRSGYNFQANPFGQKAMLLDSYLNLAALNNLALKIKISGSNIISARNYGLPPWKRGKGPWRNWCPSP